MQLYHSTVNKKCMNKYNNNHNHNSSRPILLITRMITDRIGLHSVLLPLLISISIFALESGP